MSHAIKSAALAAILALGASAATAAVVPVSLDLNGDVNITESGPVASGATLEYKFTAVQNLRVLDVISAGATGTNGGADIAAARVGLNGALAAFQTQNPSAGSSSGTSSFAGFDLAAGDMFTFTFDNANGAQEIGTTLSLSIAAVPVPAAGLLLLGALGGMGAMARRKKADA